MDAIKYFEEKNRLLDSLGKRGIRCSFICCSDCPISSNNNGKGLYCAAFELEYPEEAVAIVEKWAEEHPQKTILTDFLEKFPKAKLGEDGTPYYCCPSELGYEDEKHCRDCDCIDCWNRPI